MGKADHKERTATPAVTLGRTKTLDDPLTTGLLAEVARNAKTAEFDEQTLQALVDAASQDDDTAVIVDRPMIEDAPITHPNTRRR